MHMEFAQFRSINSIIKRPSEDVKYSIGYLTPAGRFPEPPLHANLFLRTSLLYSTAKASFPFSGAGQFSLPSSLYALSKDFSSIIYLLLGIEWLLRECKFITTKSQYKVLK